MKWNQDEDESMIFMLRKKIYHKEKNLDNQGNIEARCVCVWVFGPNAIDPEKKIGMPAAWCVCLGRADLGLSCSMSFFILFSQW